MAYIKHSVTSVFTAKVFFSGFILPHYSMQQRMSTLVASPLNSRIIVHGCHFLWVISRHGQ